MNTSPQKYFDFFRKTEKYSAIEIPHRFHVHKINKVCIYSLTLVAMQWLSRQYRMHLSVLTPKCGHVPN